MFSVGELEEGSCVFHSLSFKRVERLDFINGSQLTSMIFDPILNCHLNLF